MDNKTKIYFAKITGNYTDKNQLTRIQKRNKKILRNIYDEMLAESWNRQKSGLDKVFNNFGECDEDN